MDDAENLFDQLKAQRDHTTISMTTADQTAPDYVLPTLVATPVFITLFIVVAGCATWFTKIVVVFLLLASLAAYLLQLKKKSSSTPTT